MQGTMVMTAVMSKRKSLNPIVSYIILFSSVVCTIAWSILIGLGSIERTSLVLITCSTAFALGTLIGFVFTVFGDEMNTFGKMRDSFIALASGVAGLSIAKTAELGGLLGSIQLFQQKSEAGAWFTVLFVTTYGISGFYFMYFAREFTLNPALAEARKKLERKNELISRVSEVAAEMAKKVPIRVLSGRESIDEPEGDGDEATKKLKAALYTDEVNEFLSICEDEISKGSLPIDFINKAWALHYYRIRFNKKDSPQRLEQEEKAVEWITRIIMIDPLDPLPQIKLAEVYGLLDRDEECVFLLERLERDIESPQYIPQWLGFYLLFVEGREEDAIKYSMDYLKRFPDEGPTLFNISRAYSQLYRKEQNVKLLGDNHESENRKKALEYLSKSIQLDSSFAQFAKERSESNGSFDVLAQDPDFLSIISPHLEKNETDRRSDSK